ncbi:MAG: hypothetical protein Q9190_003361 [Brigantiaea leucoxantha]
MARPSWSSRSSRSTLSSQRSGKSLGTINLLDKPRPDPFVFPEHHHILVTTKRGVYTWGSHAITEIFRSVSEGIITAKQAKNSSGLLAIADDRMVLLHDVRKGLQDSYALKSSDGRVCVIRYNRDSDGLYFATTLQPAVRSYFQRQSKIPKSYYSHPSPPTVFALSTTSHLLLSASASPTVIQLTNLVLNTGPLLLRPQCSSANVVAAEFHPERGNIFILAFGDGVSAVYDASFIFRNSGQGEGSPAASASRSSRGWELSNTKGLHSVNNTVSHDVNRTKVKDQNTGNHSVKDTISYDGSIEVNDQNTTSIGISDQGLQFKAVAFVPGFKALVVSVGTDNKCCLVDFAAATGGEAKVIRSWHLNAPASCVSIVALDSENQSTLPQLKNRVGSVPQPRAVIAIGREDGKVLLYDIEGNCLEEQTIHQDGSRIIDVDWIRANDWPEPRILKSASYRTKRKSLGSILAGGRPVAEEVIAIIDEADANEQSRKALLGSLENLESLLGPTDKENSSKPALNHMDLFSPVKTVSRQDTNYEDTSDRADMSSMGSEVATPQKRRHTDVDTHDARPKLVQKDGLLEQSSAAETTTQRAEAALNSQEQRANGSLDTISLPRKSGNTQSVTSTNTQRLRGFRLFPSHMPKKGQASPSKDFVVAIESEESSIGTIRPAPASPGFIDDVWTDIATQSDLGGEHKRTRGSKARNKNSKETVFLPSSAESFEDAQQADLKSIQAASQTSKELNLNRFASDPIEIDGQFKIYEDNNKDRNDQKPPPTVKGTPLAEITSNSRRASVRSPFNKNSLLSTRSPVNHSRDTNFTHRLHKELMKSVVLEVDGLRREMKSQLGAQKKWFERQLKESQLWTLRVEEENRRLREELAREKKRADTRAEGRCC